MVFKAFRLGVPKGQVRHEVEVMPIMIVECTSYRAELFERLWKLVFRFER
jgi:hypothetical protein